MNSSLNGQKDQQIDSRSIYTNLSEEERDGDKKDKNSTDFSEKIGEEIKYQISNRKAAKITYKTCDILKYVISSNEESNSSSASDSNEYCDPAWSPPTVKVSI